MKEIVNNNFYSITVDENKNRLYLTVRGFWSKLDEVPEYINDFKKALQFISKGFTVLADLSTMKPPTQKIGALHVEAQELLIKAGLLKTAEIHPESMISKITVDSFSTESGMKKGMFSSIEEAKKWLDVI